MGGETTDTRRIILTPKQKREELTRQLLEERGLLCEICQERPATELHHCLFHRMKGHKELDVAENHQLTCLICHGSVANSHDNERQFWAKQCERYGEKHMLDWWESVDLRIKEKFW